MSLLIQPRKAKVGFPTVLVLTGPKIVLMSDTENWNSDRRASKPRRNISGETLMHIIEKKVDESTLVTELFRF